MQFLWGQRDGATSLGLALLENSRGLRAHGLAHLSNTWPRVIRVPRCEPVRDGEVWALQVTGRGHSLCYPVGWVSQSSKAQVRASEYRKGTVNTQVHTMGLSFP